MLKARDVVWESEKGGMGECGTVCRMRRKENAKLHEVNGWQVRREERLKVIGFEAT